MSTYEDKCQQQPCLIIQGQQIQSSNKDTFRLSKFFLINHLRVVVVAETFSEGVMVYFQLSDLCEEQEEPSEREKG